VIADLKPYPEYQPSGSPWLGDVPAHWTVRPAFGAYQPIHERNTGMREKTVLSLSYGRIVVKPIEKLRGLVPESFETYQIVNPGDIVVRTVDLQNDHTSQRIGFVHDRGIITSAYLALRTATDVLPEYGHQFLNVWDGTKAIYAYGSGLRQNLDFSHFKRMPVVVPPPDEQAAIVRFLDWANGRLERAIRAKRKVIALLNEQKQSVIHRAITGHLQHSTEAMTPGSSRWFPAIPNKWEALPMRRVLRSAIDGPHFSPQYVDEGIPFLSARNIRADRWSLTDVKYITEADYREFSKRVKPERGDVLYTKGGTTGVARAVDLDFRFQVWVHVAVLKLQRDRIDPGYLAYCLNSSRCYEQAQLFTRGATNQDLGLGRMKDIELPVPESLELQRLIVATLDAETASLVSATDKLSKEIELLREYQSSLIADTVAGRVDVQGVAQSLPRTPEGFGPGLEIDAEPESEELQQ